MRWRVRHATFELLELPLPWSGSNPTQTALQARRPRRLRARRSGSRSSCLSRFTAR
ncbi:MAG: hypothetical protein MZV63_06775 [Marinilabiliales bacterium]|nr:hypothetical protein [Marinilabiliales bacterium]